MRKNHPIRSWNLIAVGVLLAVLIWSPAKNVDAQQAQPIQIGWWTGVGVADMTRFDKQIAAGETLQAAYENPDEALTTAYFAKLKPANIKTFLRINDEAAKAGDTATLTSFVNAHKDLPEIAGWLLYDEPEYDKVTSATLIKDYKAIKAADPNHPVAIVFGNGYCSYIGESIDSNFFNALDIVMFDTYPIFDQVEFGSTADNHHQFADTLQTVVDCKAYLAKFGKQFIFVAQGFRWSPTERNPTYAEERYFTFMPFIHGVDGLLYWADYHAEPELVSIVNQVMSEATSLGTSLQNGVFNDPLITVNNHAVSYRYGSDGTNTYLFAANDTTSTVTAKFTLPSALPSVKVLFEGFDLKTNKYQSKTIQAAPDASGRSTFSDTFTQYQVHIYQLGVDNGSPEPPTGQGTSQPADTDWHGKSVTSIVDQIYVRSGPGSNYAPVGTIHQGERYAVTDKPDDQWFQIDFKGQKAYVYASNVTLVSP